MREPDARHAEVLMGWVKALLHCVYAQFDRIVDALADKLPQVAAHLELGPGPTSWLSPPTRRTCGVKIGSNNPKERLNRDPAPHTDVVGIVPDRGAIIRLSDPRSAGESPHATAATRAHRRWQQLATDCLFGALLAELRATLLPPRIGMVEDDGRWIYR